MNAKASELKKELERLFESATRESERRSKPKTFPVEMSDETKRAFSSVMLTKKTADCLEAIMTFESEIRQGEHAKAKNLAAILTKRLKALP